MRSNQANKNIKISRLPKRNAQNVGPICARKTHVTAKSMSAPIQIATTAEEKIQKSLIIDARNVTGKWKSSKVKTVLISVVNTMERQKKCLIKKSRRRK